MNRGVWMDRWSPQRRGMRPGPVLTPSPLWAWRGHPHHHRGSYMSHSRRGGPPSQLHLRGQLAAPMGVFQVSP